MPTRIPIPNTIGVFAPYAAIAPGQKGSESAILDVLANLSRDDALFACARVNTIATGFDMTVSHIDRQVGLAKQYCDEQQLQALDKFVNEHGDINKVAIFFEGQMLELARWVAKHCVHNPDDGETFGDPRVRSEFVRAALIASDLWDARVYGGRFNAEDSPEEVLQRVLGAFRKGGEQSGQAEHTGIAMARAWLMFTKYLPARMPEFDTLFQKATGLTFRSYFTCVAALLMRTLPKFEGGPLFSTEYIEGATFRNEFNRFIALRAQSPEEFAKAVWEDFDKNEFRPLRTRPIISMARGRSVIADPTYYTESLTVGPLFDLLKVTDNRKVFGAFGYAFEDYILDFLREVFPGPPRPGKLYTNIKGANGKGEAFEIDAIMTDVSDAFVMEIKASWIREDVVLTDDPANLVEELRRKYGVTESDGQQSDRKGVAQLARSIGAIARREWAGANGELTDTNYVFPILVVHDQRVSYPGVAPWLNFEFRRLLGPVPSYFSVRDLIILTVADIENLSSSINNFGFANFLRDYSANPLGRGVSVLNWMYEAKYGKLVKPPQKLWDTMDAIMDSVKDQLGPTSAGGDLEPIPQV